MKQHPFKSSAFISLSVLVTALAALLHSAQAAPLGTAFSYQGQLVDNGSPANGNYDIQFLLFDAATLGSQIAATVTLAPVAVSNGLFTVQLDYGGSSFMGDARWLQIGVRTNGSLGAYTTLTPRQPLTPTPYAIYSPNAGAAATATTATTANGVAPGSVGTAGLAPGAVNSTSIADGSIAATDLSAPFLANIALLDRTPQTFTGANIFDRGFGGPGRLIVNGNSALDLTPFTGLGFQYNASPGEGAIMSSFNDGYGFLSFYTKEGSGQPIRKQMIISRYGDVAIDQSDLNDGFLNNSSPGGVGLSFGTFSGEGIASKRTAGGNQWGLDFYTSFTRRMSLSNSGNLSFADPANSIVFPATGGANNSMIFMFASGTGNANRMVLAHSPSFPTWGLQYEDLGDEFHFLSGGTDVMTVDLVNQRVGIGTADPTAKLHVAGTSGTDGIRFPNGTLQTTAPVPVATSGFGNDPASTNRFLAPPVVLTVNSAIQSVLVTSHKAFGSASVGGAQNLDLYIGHRVSGSAVAPTLNGNGVLGNRVAQNTRLTMGLSYVISGLAPGTYEFGLAGSSFDAANWNNNEWGYTTAVLY